MAQIQKGDTFVDGQQVTASRLNQFLDSATVLPNIITDQTNLTANTVATGDSILLYDLSATALREATASDLLNSNIPITTTSVTTSSITGGAGVDIVVTPASTYKVDVAGAFEADSINSIGATTIGGTLDVTGNASFTAGIGGTSAIKIATGTTAERPASPVAGQLRFNTTSNALEVYSGSVWINGVTSGSATFDGTVNITGAIQYGGTVVYSMYEVTKHTATTTALTKGADEIWVINASDSKLNPTAMSCVIQSTSTLTGITPPSVSLEDGNNDAVSQYAFWSDVFIIPVGTTFTSKTIAITSAGTNVSFFTITKYKTA